MNKVNILGKDYEFYLSVRATKEIAKLCTDGLFENFDKDLNNKKDADRFDFISKVVIILNKAAIMKNRFDSNLPIGKWEEYEGLTEELIECLDPTFFINEVYLKAIAAINNDLETTVEVEPEKNAKKPAKKSK